MDCKLQLSIQRMERSNSFRRCSTCSPAEGPSRNIIIQRYTYPSSEQQLNPTNRSTAASRIGGDKLETQMWWQK
ncbi:hypothetical protein EO216_25960 [Flammeovirga kamogawensis]|nr:hypothetical protein EO216_25960 [Flammeovirga kamogawensis]